MTKQQIKIQEVERLRKEGKTYKEIAGIYGVSATTIYYYTEKGQERYRKYRQSTAYKVYRKSERWHVIHRRGNKAYRKRTFVPVHKLREAGLID